MLCSLAQYGGLGRCACSFWLAVAFDIVGLTVLLLGVFVSVFFYDLLIYAGAIVIFLSLIWWVFWYSGNIERSAGGIGGAVRSLSSRKKPWLHHGLPAEFGLEPTPTCSMVTSYYDLHVSTDLELPA
uniref:Si:dkeyp-72e1.6 n=1 Tax=Fundulus heteroclitus TaxID=8078 RepID=A0A3Q2QHG3_FUNHE